MARVIRVYPAYIDGEPEEVYPIDKKFLEIWAALGCSRTNTINKVFEAGLDAIYESKELEGKLDKCAKAIHEKWREVVTRMTERSQLDTIYEYLGLDEFREFCKESDVDCERFLSEYRMRTPEDTRSKVMESWLERLLSSGDEYEVDDIKEAAETEGVVSSDSDWSLMKNIASRNRYSSGGRRGYWRKLNS